jgi:hypothetical protein
MVGGTLGFIAEIASAGKPNLPANSFPYMTGILTTGSTSFAFCARQDLDVILVLWYIGTRYRGKATMTDEKQYNVQRVQTGVRMEERILRVLKAFGEYHDMTLGDLLEGIVLHAFEGKCPFGAESLKRIKDLKKFYGLDLDSRASHRLIEARTGRSPGKGKRKK